MIGDFLWWVAEKSWANVFVCVSVCLSVQAFRVVEAKRVVRLVPGRHCAMRRNAGTAMASVPGRQVARGTCHLPLREPLQKSLADLQVKWKKLAIPNSQVTWALAQLKIRLGTGASRWHVARATCPNVFRTFRALPAERLVRSRPERLHLRRINDGKTLRP